MVERSVGRSEVNWNVETGVMGIKTGILEYWNDGMMGSWIGITPIEVRGASACGGLEVEGQGYFALYLKLAPWSGGKPTPQGERS